MLTILLGRRRLGVTAGRCLVLSQVGQQGAVLRSVGAQAAKVTVQHHALLLCWLQTHSSPPSPAVCSKALFSSVVSLGYSGELRLQKALAVMESHLSTASSSW